MNEDQFNPQDQSVIDEGIASMDAQQTQEMMLSVNNKPSVTLTEEGRIVWGRGGMNNPRVVHMLDQAAADPRTLTPDGAAKCYRDIAISVVYDKANEGLSDAELAKLIADECGVNNLAYTLFPNSENSEADHKALMDAAIMPIINGRTVKMKGIAETAYTHYRANAELAQQITEREHQTRRELNSVKAVNENGEPIDNEGNVVEAGSDKQALAAKDSDQYLDTKAYLDYKADSVKTELLSVMSEAAAAYKLEHPEATDAELYNAARRAGAASYADIVNTVDNDPNHYATFQARRDARRAKDNAIYFKRKMDAKAGLDRAGELAQEVNAAVEAENNATKAENRFLVNAANENTKREMEAKYPNAVEGKETEAKRKPFKAGAPFTTQIKRSKTAGNEYTNPTLVVPQDVFDNLVADLGVKQGQYVVVQMGTASKTFTADIRVGNVNGYRMNKALFNEFAKRAGTKTQAPTHEQLSAIAAGARQSTVYFYVSDKPARK